MYSLVNFFILKQTFAALSVPVDDYVGKPRPRWLNRKNG